MFGILKQIDTKYQFTIILVVGILSIFVIQSFGHFELSYNKLYDKTPLNGNVEIQQIVYDAPFGNNIVDTETEKIFNDNPTGQISFIEKITFYTKAFMQIADRAFVISLFISITFLLVQKFLTSFRYKKNTHNNIN